MAIAADHDPASRRLALLTEYDGSGFNGWQAQARGRTVQQTLLEALQKLTGEDDLVLHGCSRTDAGVHARGHVSHFQTRCRIPAERLPMALNFHLPDDLVVRGACEINDDLHTQHHALGKIYSYRIWRQRNRPAILRQQASHVVGALDLGLMREAMPCLLGQHDFRAFMDTGSRDRSTIRTIQSLSLEADDQLLIFGVQGNGFLYHMVRILVGTLVLVAQGKIRPDSIPDILASRDRKQAGKTMPPQGLCLEQVLYDPPLFAEFFTSNTKEGDDNVQFTLG